MSWYFTIFSLKLSNKKFEAIALRSINILERGITQWNTIFNNNIVAFYSPRKDTSKTHFSINEITTWQKVFLFWQWGPLVGPFPLCSILWCFCLDQSVRAHVCDVHFRTDKDFVGEFYISGNIILYFPRKKFKMIKINLSSEKWTYIKVDKDFVELVFSRSFTEIVEHFSVVPLDIKSIIKLYRVILHLKWTPPPVTYNCSNC